MKMKTNFGTYDVELQVSRYRADGSIAISAFSPTEGPIATLTVCLADRSLDSDEAYIDTNNCPWAPDFLTENGFGRLTGSQRQSGFCVYPSMKFSNEIMRRCEV